LAQQIGELVWKIIVEGSNSANLPNKVLDEAVKIFSELLNNRFKSVKKVYIDRCVENISRNSAANECIAIIQNVVKNTYAHYINNIKIDHRANLIRYLEANCMISTLVVNSILVLKRNVIALFPNDDPEEQQQQQGLLQMMMVVGNGVG